MKIAVEVGTWHGLHEYLIDDGWTDEILSAQTGESVIDGIAANIKAYGEDPLKYNDLEDGDELEVFDGMVKFYEIHEINPEDIDQIIYNLNQEK